LAPDPLYGWDLRDYGPLAFPLPAIAGRYAGRGLVVVGDAAGVWTDLEAFGCRVDHRQGCVAKEGWDFLTVNKIVEVFPGNIEHAYSNEPSLLAKFIAARRNEYTREFTGPVNVHSSNTGAQWHWPWSGFGTSALGACFAGVGMGYDRIVLCGVPLNDGPHNGEPPWRKGGFTREAADSSDGMNRHWKRAMGTRRIFSMSGRTRDWLGAPPA
jgi:hypothetical protein